ncbi:MAG: alpha/beta fold hydrolase [Gammaproteobacteria bacterium]
MLRHVTAPDGVRLAVEVGGRGPALVMVHGAGSARWGFELVRPLLEPRFTVWELDRRGRGDSQDGDGYSLEREFDDVAAVVRAAGDGAFLFGHSYGGLLAAGAAGLLEGLQRLVLYEPPMGGVLADEAWVRRFEAGLANGERREAVRGFLHDVGGYSHVEIDAMEGTPAWERRLVVAPTVPRELRAERALSSDGLRLDRLDLACLLLVGSRSPDWARRSTEAFAAAIPGAEVRTLQGHGHGAALSGPGVLAAELEGFLLAAPP